MKNLILIALLMNTSVKAEKIIRGCISDQQGLPVAFASIGLPNTAYGTVADSLGCFVFYLPDACAKTDSLKISCVGYRPKTYALSSLRPYQEIQLLHQENHLPELVVRPSRLKQKIIGNTRGHTFLACNFAIGNKPAQNLGAEIGRKFFLRGKKHYINQVAMYLATNFDTVVFRLNIYNIRNGMPGDNLLKENIILTTTKKMKGFANFDLKKYNLAFDENIIVGIEWVGHSQKGKIVLMNLTFPSPGAVHFYKFGSQNKWKKYPEMSAAISLVTEVED